MTSLKTHLPLLAAIIAMLLVAAVAFAPHSHPHTSRACHAHGARLMHCH